MSGSDFAPSTSGSGHVRSRTASTSSTGTGSASASQTRLVRPTPVTERSLLDSVAGFISEVQQGQALHQAQSGRDPKVSVTWARFELADVNDLKVLPGKHEDWNGNAAPLLLVVGYTQGVQVWLVPANGEAQEVLSWRHGVVRTLRVLPAPQPVFGGEDNYGHCRPLICLADSTGPSTPFSVATFISLRTGEQVHHIRFNNEIVDLAVNRHVVVATFKEKLAVFCACSFAARFHISYCYPSPGVDPNPVALGDRWLAYADQRLLHVHRSFGGLETDGAQSMAAWGINVGSKLAQGVSKIYTNFFSSSSGSPQSPGSTGRGSQHSPTGPGGAAGAAVGGNAGPQKGIVTVLDLLTAPDSEGEELALADRIEGVIAHFIAHNKAIVALKFDSTGNLLLTCDSSGNYFNLFRIFPFPAGSSFSSVHHLYTLYRGDTPGNVQVSKERTHYLLGS